MSLENQVNPRTTVDKFLITISKNAQKLHHLKLRIYHSLLSHLQRIQPDSGDSPALPSDAEVEGEP